MNAWHSTAARLELLWHTGDRSFSAADLAAVTQLARCRLVNGSAGRDFLGIQTWPTCSSVGEKFPLACPSWGGEICLVRFIRALEPIQKNLIRIGEILAPLHVLTVRGYPSIWANCRSFMVQVSSGEHHPMTCP